MNELTLYTFLLLHSLVTVKFKQWNILSVLGFKEEAPAFLNKNPKVYTFLGSLLFMIAIGASLGLVALQWYRLSVVPPAAWAMAGWTGRKLAFMKYRRILKDMIANAETKQKKELYQAASDITDQEIMDIIKLFMNKGNQRSKSKSESLIPSR
jgi:hypothetical protein